MRFPRFVPFFVCLTLNTFPLFAQSPNGNINGLVSDPSAAAVVGADIVAANDVTGVQYTTKTNNEGIYVLPNLPPGPYRVQVSKIGFKTLIKPDITLNVRDSLSINFTLLVGAFHEIVTVQGGAPLVNTESAAVSTVIDHTYVENMPLNGRSFQDLILLTPGVVTTSPQQTLPVGQTGEFSVNGQRTDGNYYTVDGVSANIGGTTGVNMFVGPAASGSLPAATALGTTQALVSVESLQEFRVQSSTYSAEYGRNPGGQFAFETKSGTNQIHGAVFEYLRNGYLDAQDWFDDYFGTPQPAVRQNDFGATLGGPVRVPTLYNGKDKTFFFASYEGLRLVAPQAATANFVPDLCMRALGACPTGRNPAPPDLRQALNAFPLPSPKGVEDPTNGIAEFIGSWSNPSSLDSGSARIDQIINNKLRLLFRFSVTDSNSDSRGTEGASPSIDTTNVYSLKTYTAGASSILSNSFSNDFRMNYSSNDISNRATIDALGGAVPANLVQLSGLAPGAQSGVVLLYGPYYIAIQEDRLLAHQRQWNVVDSVGLSVGNHQFKFGVDYRRLTPFAQPPNPSAIYVYFSEGSIESNSAFGIISNSAALYPIYSNVSAFAQDEWKASGRLHLSMGLRWDINPSPGVSQGLMPYTIQGTGPSNWAVAAQGTRLWQTAWYDFAPRVGAAYVLRDAHGYETVVRVGAGVFFDTGQQDGSVGYSGPGLSSGAFPLISFPGAPSSLIPPLVNPPVPPYGLPVYGFSRHLQLPYTIQYNTSVEQALGKAQALTISFVGSHGARLLRENVISTPSNPNASQFVFIENGLTSDYDSLQGQFRRRLTEGLTTLVSYTWAHCIDYGSQNVDYGYERGNCDFDIRQNFSAAASYNLPSVGRSTPAKALLWHWGFDDRFSARTAFPVTLQGTALVQPSGQIYYGGLDLVPGQPIYLYGANCASVLQGIGDLAPGKGCPGGRAINPLAFSDVSSGFGSAPRNFARGFEAWQMDLGVRRDFPIYENFTLQFRAEAFNVFNHPNFGSISTTGSNFGQATATLASSLGVLNPLYQMGGPRSMQFALRFLF